MRLILAPTFYRFLTNSLSVERLTVAIADLPPSLVGTRMVQLSDFHYDGFRLPDKLLRQAIAASNQADPDIILLTGDYITDNPAPIYALAAHLKTLRSRLGIYAILGNHDIYYQYGAKAEVTAALTRVGIQVLWNQVAYPFGQALPLVGLADLRSREFNPAPVLAQISDQTPRIVLSHNPDSAAVLESFRVDLQLSGHTHGGQIVLPGLGPIAAHLNTIRQYIPFRWRRRLPYLNSHHLIVRHWQWAQGLHRIGRNQLYVNRGLGAYFPGRFLCPPEVTIITLTTQAEGKVCPESSNQSY